MEREKYGPCLSKRTLHFLAVLCKPMGCPSAYFLGKQGGSDATLLPERVIVQNRPSIQHFKR